MQEKTKLNVLIGCEESQAVTKAFRKLGHECYSCDLEPCSGGHPEWHLQDTLFNVLDKQNWDLIIAFPPCTHLSAAGAPSWKIKQEDGRQKLAIDFVLNIANYANCKYVAIENPTGILSSKFRKPDQIINPFQFGDPFRKRTCLWLKNLPLLVSTEVVKPQYHYTSNSTRGGLLKDGTRKKSELPIYKAWDSAKERSKTFPGIAKAMAEQWSSFILSNFNTQLF